MKFGREFMWGTASSGPQSEGAFNKANESIWDYWYKQEPERFHNFIGPGEASDVYHEFSQDANLMKEIGLNSFRTSIQWSRVIKDLETGEVSEEGIQFYRKYFKELKQRDIKVIVNLFHYDMPIDLQRKYEGFLSEKVCNLFVDYAKVCFENFDDLVDLWTTFNEPMAYAKEAYHDNRIYPCELDFDKMLQLNHNTVVTNARCIEAYKEGNYTKEIGIILDCLPPMPRSSHPLDVEAAKKADLLTNKLYLDPCVLGKYDQEYLDFIQCNDLVVKMRDEELTLIRNYKVDFIGINYYRPMRVKAPTFEPNTNSPKRLEHFYENYEMPNCRMNKHRGWEIYPKAMYEIGIRIRDEYNNIKWFVSENGMGVENEEQFRNEKGIIEDDYRIEFIQEHLYWLNKVISEESSCFGYQIWTFIDNWSWLNAYKNRYGYVEYNLKTKERKRKKSSYWIESVIKNDELNVGGQYE